MATCTATCAFKNLRTSRILFTQSTRSISGRSNTHDSLTNIKKDPFYPVKKLVENYLEKTSPILDYGSIYEKYPHAKKALIGQKPERRMVWEEQDCAQSFPESPEAANLDLLNYLEQRDMWQRHQNLEIPKFCIGSIVAVTRADPYAPEGWTRFVGLCINKNISQNNKGSNFILRNVIQGQPLEIQYPIYNPLIQKIEVLRHQRWENEKPGYGLRFLRDLPPQYSTVDSKMESEPYTDEPSVRPWTQEDKDTLVKWFNDIFESRRRR